MNEPIERLPSHSSFAAADNLDLCENGLSNHEGFFLSALILYIFAAIESIEGSNPGRAVCRNLVETYKSFALEVELFWCIGNS